MSSEARRFQCMFCGLGIESSGYDPCALVVIALWEEGEDKQREQQFWCHSECIRAVAAKNVPFYIFEPDFDQE